MFLSLRKHRKSGAEQLIMSKGYVYEALLRTNILHVCILTYCNPLQYFIESLQAHRHRVSLINFPLVLHVLSCFSDLQ